MQSWGCISLTCLVLQKWWDTQIMISIKMCGRVVEMYKCWQRKPRILGVGVGGGEREEAEIGSRNNTAYAKCYLYYSVIVTLNYNNVSSKGKSRFISAHVSHAHILSSTYKRSIILTDTCTQCVRKNIHLEWRHPKSSRAVNDENEIGLRFLDSSKSELYSVRQHREYWSFTWSWLNTDLLCMAR